MAEVLLSLDGITANVTRATAKDISTLENYRLQLTGRLTKELGHSPVRLAEIERVVRRIDFELAARAIEDVVSEGAISVHQLGQGIRATLEAGAKVLSPAETLETVS